MRKNLTILLVFIITISLIKTLHAQSVGIITTVAGGGSFEGVQANNALLNSPEAVALDSSGNLYIYSRKK
jgi:hypothetical protein